MSVLLDLWGNLSIIRRPEIPSGLVSNGIWKQSMVDQVSIKEPLTAFSTSTVSSTRIRHFTHLARANLAVSSDMGKPQLAVLPLLKRYRNNIKEKTISTRRKNKMKEFVKSRT